MVLDPDDSGRAGAEEERRSARTKGAGVTNRHVGLAVTAGSAVFCGCAATLFMWAIPAVAGPGTTTARVAAGAPLAAGAGGTDPTVPPGGTVQYMLHVDPKTRDAVVKVSASPQGATVHLSCPAGAGVPAANGPACRLSAAGPADIPASVYVPASFPPGTVVRVSEVVPGSSGVTVEDMVIRVSSAAGPAANPAPSGRPPAHSPHPAATAKPTGTASASASPARTSPRQSQPSGSNTPTPASSPSQTSTGRPQPANSAAHTPAPSTTQTAPSQPRPGGSATPTPAPCPAATPSTAPSGRSAPTPKPSRSTAPKPGHSSSSPKPGHSSSSPKPGHGGAAPPPGGSTNHPGPPRGSHPAPVGTGHGTGPLSGGRGAPAAPEVQRPLPLPTVIAPGAIAGADLGRAPPGGGQANAGTIGLPRVDGPAPAPILPTAPPLRAQPSPLPLPRVTPSPTGDPSASQRQVVVLPNRARTASSDPPFTFDLVEAQIIGFLIALAGSLAVVLRPLRKRSGRPAVERPERSAERPPAAARQPRFPHRWLRAHTR